MKKRHLTTILLIWLVSQQLFATVWAMPNTGMDCVEHSQNTDCMPKITEHMGHAVPTMNATDGSVAYDASPMVCDLCSITCQPSVISNTLLPLIKTVHVVFEAQSIDAPVDTFLSTLYRPPILV
jgi:hypothetical protein